MFDLYKHLLYRTSSQISRPSLYSVWRCSGGWKAYDEQFRLRMAQDPSSAWTVIYPELWLIYICRIRLLLMEIIFQLIKIELINATVVSVRIMHVLSVILASGVLVNIQSFSVHDKIVCLICQMVRQDFVILKLDPDFRVRYQITRFNIFIGKKHKSLLQVNLAIIIIKLSSSCNPDKFYFDFPELVIGAYRNFQMFTKAEEKKNFYLNCGKKEKLQSMLLIWKNTLPTTRNELMQSYY